MREIKFREWVKEFDSMLYEVYFHEEVSIDEHFNDCNRTLMQYTGLKDINGKEIYESDIVKVISSADDAVLSYEEVTQLPCGVWYLTTSINEGMYDVMMYSDNYIEIAGNLYENPELLEEIQK